MSTARTPVAGAGRQSRAYPDDGISDEQLAGLGLVRVWDTATGESRIVSKAEAAAGMVRYARTLGPGSPACGQAEEQAMDMARGDAGAPVRPGRVMTAPPRTADEIRASVAARQAQAQRAAEEREGRHWASPAQPAVPAAYCGEVEVRPAAAVVATRQDIDGDQVLRYIYTFLKRFAVWGSEHEIVTATLWIAHTHARDGKGMPIWQYCARLAILGESGSGKSWKTRLIGKLSYSGEILVVPTKPAFIDLCAENHTIILTEADEQFRSSGKSRDLIAIANASYEPDRSAPRKQGGVVVKVPVFCHLVLDGIAEVLLTPNRPDLRALMSRCIIFMSAKAPDGYRPPRFDRQARAIAEQIGQRAGAWMGQEAADGMEDDVPAVPEHLGNRAFALWEPLFVVARRADMAMRRRLEAAGEETGDDMRTWTDAVTEACIALESGPGLPEETEDAASELDRTMAEWGMAS